MKNTTEKGKLRRGAIATLIIPALVLGGALTSVAPASADSNSSHNGSADGSADGSAISSSSGGSKKGSTSSRPKVGSSHVTSDLVVDGDEDPFYNTDNVVPTQVGEILRTQEAVYSGILGDNDLALPSTAEKIMYTSLTADGMLTPITGYVVEPTVPWRGQGPRPTVVIVRGTVGQGDHCAASRNWPLDGQPDPVYSGRTVNIKAIYDMVFARHGVRVVVSDLIGVGTPGVHTYMNRDDQAHAILDAARATRTLVERRGEEFGQVALYGHSQGGGASAPGAEAQPSYAPDIDLAAAYSSAPPANLEAVLQNIDGSDLTGAIGYAVDGLVERYPHIAEVIDDNVSEKGVAALRDISHMCTDEIRSKYGYMSSREWIKGQRSLTELLLEYPEVRKVVEDQYIGHGRPDAPVMIISGRFDRGVAYGQAKHLAQSWCSKGATVVYRDDFLPEIGTLGERNHIAQAASGGAFGIPFILGAFNGNTIAESGVCTNWFGNEGSSAADLSSGVSSIPLSSAYLPPVRET